VEGAGTAVCLVMKAVLLSGRWAGRTRRLGLEQAAKASGDGAEVQAENVMLRDLLVRARGTGRTGDRRAVLGPLLGLSGELALCARTPISVLTERCERREYPATPAARLGAQGSGNPEPCARIWSLGCCHGAAIRSPAAGSTSSDTSPLAIGSAAASDEPPSSPFNFPTAACFVRVSEWR